VLRVIGKKYPKCAKRLEETYGEGVSSFTKISPLFSRILVHPQLAMKLSNLTFFTIVTPF